jgi:hypothetical protein
VGRHYLIDRFVATFVVTRTKAWARRPQPFSRVAFRFGAIALIPVSSFCITGCVLLNVGSEGSVLIRGRIADVQPNVSCDLRLHRDKRATAGERKIPAEFRTSVVIAPGRHNYYVEVSCEKGKFKSSTYELGGMEELDLGLIALQ